MRLATFSSIHSFVHSPFIHSVSVKGELGQGVVKWTSESGTVAA